MYCLLSVIEVCSKCCSYLSTCNAEIICFLKPEVLSTRMLNNWLSFLHSHSNLATGCGKSSSELPELGQKKLPLQNQPKMCLDLQYIIENTFWIIQYIFLYLLNNNTKKGKWQDHTSMEETNASNRSPSHCNLKHQMFPSNRSSKICGTYMNL